MPERDDKMIGYMQKTVGMLRVASCVYMDQHEHFEAWGYPRFACRLKKLSKVNLKMAHLLLIQLEFFDVGAGSQEYDEVKWPRHDIEGIIRIDIAMEEEVRTISGEAKKYGVSIGDPVSANRFTKLAAKAQKAISVLQAMLSVADATSYKMLRQNLNLD